MPNEQHAHTPISQLDITPYAIRCLKKNGVHSVQQLLSMSAVDLLRLPGNGLGKGSLQVITESLAKKGLQLKGETLKSPSGPSPTGLTYQEDTMTTETTTLAVIEPANAIALFIDRTGLDSLLTDIRQQATSLVPDITTAKGRKEIASVAHAVARTKTYLDGLGKDLVDQYKEIPKRIDANRKQIRDELDKLKDEVRAPLTAYEDAERERTESLQARLDNIKLGGEMPVTTPGATSEQLSQWLEQVTAIPLGDDWEERLSEATVAKETAINKLTSALSIRKQYEAEQAELERLRHEQAKRDQEERERQIAERARQQEAERQLQERAEAQRRELAAKQQAEQARRDAELAEQRRIEAEASAKRQAEEAAAKAAEQERQRIEAEQQSDMAARAKREADTEHRRAINNRIIGDLMIECDVDPDQARKIAEAIVRGKISNVSVNY